MATIKELYDKLGEICDTLSEAVSICDDMKMYFPGGTEQGGMLCQSIECLISAKRDLENLRG